MAPLLLQVHPGPLSPQEDQDSTGRQRPSQPALAPEVTAQAHPSPPATAHRPSHTSEALRPLAQLCRIDTVNRGNGCGVLSV